jgi:hypothetical protein
VRRAGLLALLLAAALPICAQDSYYSDFINGTGTMQWGNTAAAGFTTANGYLGLTGSATSGNLISGISG